MSDTVINMPDGSKWSPSSSTDVVKCANCGNEVDTPAEIASYPDGDCPDCGEAWTGSEVRKTTISVTAPEKISGST
tara:strand:+ start:4269 stop:4496 length:228 start_codon:yes stop_codon:yes gene_type:complete